LPTKGWELKCNPKHYSCLSLVSQLVQLWQAAFMWMVSAVA